MTSRLPRALAALLLTLFVALGAVAIADPDRLDELLARRPDGAVGTVVVPDRFVRPWDPVTIFFASPAGPAGGGPEDDPGRFARVSPAHPGAWRWVDARTLQFKPAEPWPPLARYHWRTGSQDVVLSTLVAPPQRTIPANGAEGLEPVDAITLTFSSPMEPEVLAEMIRIELRDLPGVGGAPTQVLTASDFSVKAMDRASASASATYVLRLDSPIGHGQRATLRMRLSRDDSDQEAVSTVDFSTAPPFRVSRFGCSGGLVPVTTEGTRYTRDQALGCGSGAPAVVVEFSSPPADLGPVEARNLLRFEPAVEGVEVSTSGTRLEVRGDFKRETLYTVRLAPTALKDRAGRDLEISGESEVWLFFPRRSRYLKWSAGDGIAERNGPKRVPLEGRGHERADLRVYSVDPLDRSLWPFTSQPIAVDESQRPPGPGEEPAAHDSATNNVHRTQLVQHLRMLGSPPVSELVELPLREDGGAAEFGLDLTPYLEHLDGRGAAGHYLVGIRSLDDSSTRSWMRLQVTDLALSTVEEPEAVQFVVTSLATGRPVSSAVIRVEGSARPRREEPAWTTLMSGRTDGQGVLRWEAPGSDPERVVEVRRIVVEKGDDVLVLDAAQAPETYRDRHWSPTRSTWLQWAFQSLNGRAASSERLAHVYTERPVYRPEEPVHVRGYLRDRDKGTLAYVQDSGHVVVRGPGGLSWREPVTLDATGGFYFLFDEDEIPTGDYTAAYEDEQRRTLGQVGFKVEAYRIPRFEVEIHGEDEVPMDREFELSMTAEYYAGGQVAGQPVRWRVTQYPYTWTPPGLSGFLFSSDGRYSRSGRFDASPELEKMATTDENGASTIILDPSVEANAQPRSYVVEATVTGADDQTVTTTKTVRALPPFVVGVKLPRYLPEATAIEPQLAVVGFDGQLVEGQPMTVRLKRREWHSHLQASDFSDGVARYVTDIVDEPISETSISSGKEPISLALPIDRAGVYLVEVESQDRLGRAQVVQVDLYAGGDDDVAWEKPTTSVFELSADAEAYAPGDTANLVIRSPWRSARALVIAETPEGNTYEWVNVRGGKATTSLRVRKTWVPRLPVHVVLMRGRIDGAGASPDGTDLGKPATMASTAWVEVKPVENTVQVSLEHAERALPGQEVPVTIRLKDHRGEPLAGEVTMWLVDAAVLALGQEQRLDPLPDFITNVRSRLAVLDTRNLAFGALPFAEMPGGDGEDRMDDGLLERVAIRKDFRSVPYYEPRIQVGRSGVTEVVVKLPDNLTNFKLRAKATAGPERFGVGKSQIAVRLPLIVQPALPRFVRPGDTFDAVAIGRVVEGEGGAGQAVLQAEGLSLQSGERQAVTWQPNVPERLTFPVTVQDPGYTPLGDPARDSVTVTVAVERAADGASDAFQVSLPIRPDRAPIITRAISELNPGTSVELPAVPGPVRPGTLRRTVLVADHPGIVKMATGLEFLVEQPYGCTEQKLSRARALLALKDFRLLLRQGDASGELEAAVNQVLADLPQAIDRNGLVAYWPGARGYVSLTAWTVMFLVEAEDAGFAVDPSIMATLTGALQRSLRSDYGYFINGEAYAERTWALNALAATGQFDPAYFAELARKAQWMDAEGVTQVVQAGYRGGQGEEGVVEQMLRTLSEGVITRLYQGNEIYAGLTARRARSGLILPSETRLLAQITRSLMLLQPDHPKLPLMLDALVELGEDDGWGNTNTNAEALLALSERLRTGDMNSRPHLVTMTVGESSLPLRIGPKAPAAVAVDLSGEGGALTLTEGEGPLVAQVETRYLPGALGSLVPPENQGFVVTRRWLKQVPGSAPEKLPIDDGGKTLSLTVGDVVEEHVQVVVPEDRYHVAVVVPLAAGVEPLNPRLATAPPEAQPSSALTRDPTYAAYYDDAVSFFYDVLPKGTYDFYFRTRAATPGQFTQPPAQAQKMYDLAVMGRSPGARVVVE
ncbi:MAG: alpha-2-macroglobulin [Alphaproteobacteria bacterium]|nr:alpha-2-macroglobulin [Alphaproteobacteria bacterium]